MVSDRSERIGRVFGGRCISLLTGKASVRKRMILSFVLFVNMSPFIKKRQRPKWHAAFAVTQIALKI